MKHTINLFVLFLVGNLLVACGAPTATPVTEAPTATPTPAEPAGKTGVLCEGSEICAHDVRCEGSEPQQICVRDARTGGVTQVTENLEFGRTFWPSWSPDGQQIVFNAGPDVSPNKLYIINANGSDLRQITNGDFDVMPAWSPDREWIAFNRSGDLWLIRPDGSDGRQLIPGSDHFFTEVPAWSRDSQRIALSNVFEPGKVPAYREVWVVNRDGSNPHVVYSFEEPLEWLRVAWSPDGQQIACRMQIGHEEQAFLVNTDGSGELEKIESDEIPWSWFHDFWPQWSGQ